MPTKSNLIEENAKLISEENAIDFLKKYANTRTMETQFVVHTSFGDITLELFQNTPLHLANFNFLFDNKYYDNTWFYRVSANHVIQAGNTDGRETVSKRKAIGTYTLTAEALEKNLHTYGALAAARSYKDNPHKQSDPYEFYIVLGKKYAVAELKLMADEYSFELNTDKIKTYSAQGGAPHLDGEHTVFGRVVEGMDVVEEIAKQKTDEGEWPLLNIPITLSKK